MAADGRCERNVVHRMNKGSNQSQHVMVDGCQSKLIEVVSGVLQGCVLCPLLYLLYTSELFSILDSKLIGYADDYFDGYCAIPWH